jgi:hypothetical protein
MLKEELTRFQLLDDAVRSESVEELKAVVDKVEAYLAEPDKFTYDAGKAKREKEEKERRLAEEGKRKAYEARLQRKAKREGKELDHYLKIGATVPTRNFVEALRGKSRAEQLPKWTAGNHGQHCIEYHVREGGCQRDRKCAFLHVDAEGKGGQVMEAGDEVAG